MTDRELLEMAARAAEYQVDQRASFATWRESRRLALLNPQGGHTLWNASEDDGDALRLAVKLRLEFEWWKNWVSVKREDQPPMPIEHVGSDPYAATRRAVVRAAAAIGSKQDAARKEST